MLLTPIFAPVAMMAGIDPVHLASSSPSTSPSPDHAAHGSLRVRGSGGQRLEITALFRTIWPFVVTALLVLAA